MKKKFLGLAIALCMFAGVAPVATYAVENTRTSVSANQPTPMITGMTAINAVYGYTEGTAKVTATVTKETGYTYTYQWYSNSTKSNLGGTAISGATAETYSLPAGKNAGDYYFYCVVTATGNGKSASVASNAVTVTIDKALMTVTADNVIKTYDGKSHGITVNVTKPASGTTKKYGEKAGSYTLSTSPVYSTYGIRTVYYEVTDNNNNYYPYTGTATVSIADTTAPTGKITIGGKSYTSFVSSISFGTYMSASQKVAIEMEDAASGEDEICYYISQSAISSTKIKELNEDKWVYYEDEFSMSKDGKYIIYARLTDMAGNIRYISTGGFILDGTEPEIKGIEDDGEECQNVSVTVTDTYLSTVTVDSSKKTVSNGKCTFTLTGDGKTHTVRAEDKAGNEIEYTVKIFEKHEYGDFKQKKVEGEWSLEEAECKRDCGKKYKRYRKNTDIMAEEDPSGGSVAMNVEVKTGAPAVSVKGLDTEVAKKLVSDAQERAKKGEDVLVYLDVTKQTSVGTTDKTATESAITQSKIQNLKEGMYLDMTMYKKIGETTATKIDNATLAKKLTFSMTLPDTLKAPAGKSRTYYVVRVHNGTATVLNTTLKDNVISFETDRFSTYSVWYTETEGTANAAATGAGTANAAGGNDKVPQTGDEGREVWYALLCLLSGAGAVYFGKRNFLK